MVLYGDSRGRYAKQMTGKRFYVYEHWRPDRGECFYVGKGCGSRANQMGNGRNRHHKAIQAKLSRLGLPVEVRIVEAGLAEAEAFALEADRIAFWRSDGADLVNLTDGGDGAAGAVRSDAFRQAVGDRFRGRKHSPEARAKMSVSHKGAVISRTQRAKQSAAMSSRIFTDAWREKISVAVRRRLAEHPRSAETNTKIAETLRNRAGRPQTPEERAKRTESCRAYHATHLVSQETRDKISAAARNRPPPSEAARRKMSESHKARNAAARLAKVTAGDD